MSAPTFAEFPLSDSETMADALESALRDCSGAEPSLSVLFIRAEQSVPVMRELFDGLERAFVFICHNMPLGPTDDRTEAGKLIDSLRVPLATARGEQ